MGGGGGLLGAVTEPIFGDGGARAAEKAAMAQQRMSQQQFDYMKQLTGESVAGAKEASTASLLSFDKALQAQERMVGRQEEMVKQIDPAILEASQQALRLLRGEQSSLGPDDRQRQTQRQTLLNSLRERLGPGAETSTAGMQALNRFDAETNGMMSGMRQQALGTLGNTINQLGNYGQQFAGNISGLGSLSAGRFDIANAPNAMRMQMAGVMGGAGQQQIANAGAQYTGDVLRGQQNQALLNTAIGAGAQFAGSYFGSKAKT